MVRQTYIPDPDEPGLKLWVSKHTCSRCQVEKLTDEFYLSSTTSSGYQNYCMSCQADYNREMRVQAPEQYESRLPNATKPLVVQKWCSDCTEVKPAQVFHRNKRVADGLAKYCKECSNRRRRESRDRSKKRKC